MRWNFIAALALCSSATLLGSITAMAQSPSIPPFDTELGFRRLSDSATPETLKRIAQSVFEVRVISEESTAELEVLDLTLPKYSNIEAGIDTIPDLDALERVVLKKQVQHCKERGAQTHCDIYFGIEKGTAFLAGDNGESLWTNAHLVDRALNIQAILNNSSIYNVLRTQPRVNVFIFDQSGELVFDPFEETATIENFPRQAPISAGRGRWYAENTDYVEIKLSRSIGAPLEIGPRIEPGAVVYRPGYAGCTGCGSQLNLTDPLLNNDRGDGKNSVGTGLYWTAGRTQDLNIVNQFLNTDIKNFIDPANMIFFNSDAQVGMSGGPIINSSGQVIGIFAGSKPRLYGSKMEVLSRGVRPPEFGMLTQ